MSNRNSEEMTQKTRTTEINNIANGIRRTQWMILTVKNSQRTNRKWDSCQDDHQEEDDSRNDLRDSNNWKQQYGK